jgi:ABC-2 type transport system ATP-binding protein
LYGLTRHKRETRAQKLLAEFGLTEAAARKFGGYSKGMKRKLTIAAGIIHKPTILFLDEPTSGIDVASARQIRQLIASLNQAGTTIFLTTHYIEEAERLCQRIAFIVKGRIVCTETVQALMQETEGRYIVQFSVSGMASPVCRMIDSQFSALKCSLVSEQAFLAESPEPVRIGPLIRFIEDELDTEVTEARKMNPSLEDVFVRITGIEAAAMEMEKNRKKTGGGA